MPLCKFCNTHISAQNLSRHEPVCKENPITHKTCPVCSKIFSSLSFTCSISCANIHFRSGKNNHRWRDHAYRTTCFLYHKKECVVCGENKIVAVHHMDEDKKNNSMENLIHLCPTHHQYFHSKHRHEVLPKIEEYARKIKETIVS